MIINAMHSGNWVNSKPGLSREPVGDLVCEDLEIHKVTVALLQMSAWPGFRPSGLRIAKCGATTRDESLGAGDNFAILVLRKRGAGQSQFAGSNSGYLVSGATALARYQIRMRPERAASTG